MDKLLKRHNLSDSRMKKADLVLVGACDEYQSWLGKFKECAIVSVDSSYYYVTSIAIEMVGFSVGLSKSMWINDKYVVAYCNG